MSQNFRLFHVSNISVLNIRTFLLKYPGSPCGHVGLIKPVLVLSSILGPLESRPTSSQGPPSATRQTSQVRQVRAPVRKDQRLGTTLSGHKLQKASQASKSERKARNALNRGERENAECERPDTTRPGTGHGCL